MPKHLIITVPGPPLAKKRHRTVPMLQCTGCQKKIQGQYRECPSCNGQLRFVTNLSYSDSESVRYENLISYCAKQAMQQQGIEMFTGAIRVRMTFLFPVPISRQCKKHPDGKEYSGVRGCGDSMDNHADPFSAGHSPTEMIRNASKNGCKRLHPGDAHTQRPDLDNLNKSLDGLNGIVFADDCIIAEASARKQWAAEGKAEIIVEEMI